MKGPHLSKLESSFEAIYGVQIAFLVRIFGT